MTNKERFANDLRLIEVETFSFCNRVCWFCTNSIIDRKTTNMVMPERYYLGILDQLNEIKFKGELTFSRYNEPLSQKDLILTRIKQAREVLGDEPILRINTNGDYLTHEYIEELADAGLSQLWIQQYLGNGEKYDHEKVRGRMNKTLKRIKWDREDQGKMLTDIDGCKLEYELFHNSMTVHIRARNFDIDGSSRGGLLDVAKDYTRTEPCKQVSENMYIDWNGTVMVCCEMRSEVKEHSSGVMGSVHTEKLWDIYYASSYKSWRDHHLDNSPKKGACKSCKQGVKPSYE